MRNHATILGKEHPCGRNSDVPVEISGRNSVEKEAEDLISKAGVVAEPAALHLGGDKHNIRQKKRNLDYIFVNDNAMGESLDAPLFKKPKNAQPKR